MKLLAANSRLISITLLLTFLIVLALPHAIDPVPRSSAHSEFDAFIPKQSEPTCTPENVAAAANGATVSASSTYNSNFPTAAAINGDRSGSGWGSGTGGWNDGTQGGFPDNLQINFAGPRQIETISVFTLQDNYSNPIEPTDLTTFTLYGTTSYQVEYWTGAAWISIPNGIVTGNNKVKRSFTFSPILTDKIRVVVNDSADHQFSRIVEVEALGCDPVVAPPVVSNGIIAFETNRDGNREIYSMSADGTSQTRLTNNAADDKTPAFSPDGTKITFVSDRDGNYEVYVMNVDGTNQTRLTSTPQNELWPSFSPDGTKIAYNRSPGNASEIFVMNANGTNIVQLTSNSFADDEPRWSPDGTRIVFHSNRHHAQYEIYVMNADGTNVDRLTNNNFVDAVGSFSPGGSKILFESNRSGNYEVMVMNIDGTNAVNLSQSTLTSDANSRWSPDGTKIVFYSARDGNAELYTMNADGTGQTRLTVLTAVDENPAWQPIWP